MESILAYILKFLKQYVFDPVIKKGLNALWGNLRGKPRVGSEKATSRAVRIEKLRLEMEKMVEAWHHKAQKSDKFEDCGTYLTKFFELTVKLRDKCKRIGETDRGKDLFKAESDYLRQIDICENATSDIKSIILFMETLSAYKYLSQSENQGEETIDRTDWETLIQLGENVRSAFSMSTQLNPSGTGITYLDYRDKALTSHIKVAQPYEGYWKSSEDYILNRAQREFKKLRDQRKRLHCLDLGCGEGRLTIRFADLFDSIVALDPDASRLEITKRRSENSGKNIEYCNKPFQIGLFKERSFDVVICSHVIQHLKTGLLDAVLCEMANILRPGGILLLSTSSSRRSHEEYLVDGLDITTFPVSRRHLKHLKTGTAAHRLITELNQWGLNLSYDFCCIHETAEKDRCWILEDRENGQKVTFLKNGSQLTGQYEEREGLQFAQKSMHNAPCDKIHPDLEQDVLCSLFSRKGIDISGHRYLFPEKICCGRACLILQHCERTSYLLLLENLKVNVFKVLFSVERKLSGMIDAGDMESLAGIFQEKGCQLQTTYTPRTLIPQQLWEIRPSGGGRFMKKYLIAAIGETCFVSYGMRMDYISKERFDDLLPENPCLLLPTHRFAVPELEHIIEKYYTILFKRYYHMLKRFPVIDRAIKHRRDFLANLPVLKDIATIRRKLDVADVAFLCKRLEKTV